MSEQLRRWWHHQRVEWRAAKIMAEWLHPRGRPRNLTGMTDDDVTRMRERAYREAQR